MPRRRLGGIRHIGVVLGLGAALVWRCDAGPLELFWDTTPRTMLRGGPDLPGPLLGVPDVEFPASLARSDRPRLSTTWTFERPAIWSRAGRRVGDVTTTGLSSLELSGPVLDSEGPTRFAFGVELRRLDTEADLDRPRSVTAFEEDAHAERLAVGYRAGRGLCLGVSLHESRREGSASLLSWVTVDREAVRDDIEVGFDLEADGWSIGAELRRPGRLLGAQFSSFDVDSFTGVRDGRVTYQGQWHGDGQVWDAYYRHGRDRRHWFVQARRHEVEGDGPLAGGRLERGLHRFSTRRTLVRAGWQGHTRRWEHTVSLEFDEWSMHLDGFADTEPLPHPLGERRGMDGHLRLETIGVRGGAGRRVSRHCTLHAGLSFLRSEVDGTLITKQRQSLVSPIKTRTEPSLDGHITMGSVSVGVKYASRDWEILSAYSVFAADMSRSLRKVLNPPPLPPPPDQPRPPGTSLDWSHAVGLEVTRQF